MKSIQTFLVISLFSVWAFAQAANHPHYGTASKSGTSSKTNQAHHSTSNSAVAAETIAAANRETSSQQKELSQIERGSTHVKRSPAEHPATVKAPKEHSTPNAPINFAYHPPKQQNSRPATGRTYSAH